MDYDELRRIKLENEAKNPKPPAKKNVAEVVKRIKVGALILSFFITVLYMGVIYQLLWVLIAAY